MGEKLGRIVPDDRYNHQQSSLEQSKCYYSRLIEEDRVGYSSEFGGFYVLSDHETVRKSLSDWEKFSSAQGVRLPMRPGPRIVSLEMDSTEHAEWRRLFLRALTPKRLASFAADIEHMCDELIDAFAPTGKCELVHDFCMQLPVKAVMRVVGLDEVDCSAVIKTAMDIAPGATDAETARRGLADFADMTMRAVEARRATPRDDYLTEVINARVAGQLIPDELLCNFMLGFFTAGHESTATALGCTLFYVLKEPGLRDRILAEPKLLSAAMEEALRLHAPFTNFFRTTTCPVNVKGTVIPEGQKVMIANDGANRDPNVFPEPDQFRLDRPRGEHIAFGYGPHLCAGQHLARMEIELAVRRLLTKLPDIEILTDTLDQEIHGSTIVVNRALPARFTPPVAKNGPSGND